MGVPPRAPRPQERRARHGRRRHPPRTSLSPPHLNSCSHTSCLYLILQNTVSLYRLIILRFHTPALTAFGPGTPNDPPSKATFYVFHAAPELLAAALLFAVDVRERCGTGLMGDTRSTDKKVESEGGKV